MKKRIVRSWIQFQQWLRQIHEKTGEEDGMTTAEYAIGTIAAAAFAGLLLAVIQGGGIKDMLLNLIKQALSV